MKVTWILVCFSALTVAFFSCNKESKDSADTEDSEEIAEDETETGKLAVNGDTSVVPKDLLIAAVTQSLSSETLAAMDQSQTGSIAVEDGASLQGSGFNDYYSLKQDIQKTLTTDNVTECAAAIPQEFSLAQGNLFHASCFGPNLEFTNHPDTNENGQIGNGDLGIFSIFAEPDATSGEACAANVMNNTAQNSGAYVNAAMGIQAMVACVNRLQGAQKLAIKDQGKVDSDVTTNVAETQEFESLSISTAIISQVDDQTNETTVEGVLTDVPRNITSNFSLKVRQTVTGEETYKGVLQFQLDRLIDGEHPGVISVVYEKTAPSLNYRFRQTRGDSEKFDPTTMEVQPASDQGSGWNEILANVDKFGFGKMSIGVIVADAVVFNAETKPDGTGVAFFGHRNKLDVTKGDFLKIQGLTCYPIKPAPPSYSPYSSFVQRQTLKLDEQGHWNPEESKIAYAPTTTCSWNADNDAGQTAQFTVKMDKGPDADAEDSPLAYPLEADLYPVADYTSQWTSPVVPIL